VTLLDAPENALVRITEVAGGEGVRRRLLSLGFHRQDVVRVESRAPFRGPVFVLNVTSGCRTALGRGVAQKVLVEEADGDR
jgi:Fe2+ transport system protein FeoA